MRYTFFGRARRGSAFELKLLSKTEEVTGSGLGYASSGHPWSKLVVVAENMAKDFDGRKSAGRCIAIVQEVVEFKGVDASRQVLKLRVNLKTFKIADHKKRGILKGLVVLVQLLVGLLEVASFGLVLPGEVTALPNVGESTFAGTGLSDVLLVGVAGTNLVGLCGMGDVKDFAEIAKVLGRGGTFSQ